MSESDRSGDGLAHPDTQPVAAPDARWAAAPAAGLVADEIVEADRAE